MRAIAGLLEENGHQVNWFLRSSADIKGAKEETRAFFSGIHSPGAVKALCRFLQEYAVDVALVQNLYPLLSPSILPVLRQAGIPVVMRCPNYRLFCPIGLHLYRGKICERCLNGREYWCVIRNCENSLAKSVGYALRNATARISRRIVDNVEIFVVLSEFQRQRFIAEGILPERLAVVPNVAPVVTNDRSDDLGRMVSFVGRVSQEKGIADFLDAAARLPDIPFAVAGDYEQMPELTQKSSGNVRWMGFLTGKDLEAFYRQSRLLVFPGRWFEGFPNVIAGAMALGKPVIASRLGGVPEIVEHRKTGLLFESGNVPELIKAIERLYNNPSLCTRLGQAGSAKAETDYSRKAVYERWREVLGRALDSRPHSTPS